MKFVDPFLGEECPRLPSRHQNRFTGIVGAFSTVFEAYLDPPTDTLEKARFGLLALALTDNGLRTYLVSSEVNCLWMPGLRGEITLFANHPPCPFSRPD